MYPGNVPDSSPTTVTSTWITRLSDALPDSGLLWVLSQHLGGWRLPHSVPVCFGGCFCQQLHQSGTQDHREHPGIVIVFRRDKKSLVSYRFSEGGYGNRARTLVPSMCRADSLRLSDKGGRERRGMGDEWRKTGVPGDKDALCICTGINTRVTNRIADPGVM